MKNNVLDDYSRWTEDPSPANMGSILKAIHPLLISQISQYPGDNKILRGRAKAIARDAVKSYNPESGVKLTSWIVTQLQPLSRYGRKSRQIVNVPEVAYRQYSELDARRREYVDEHGMEPTDDDLADTTGLSVKRIRSVREMNPAVTSTGTTEDAGEDIAALSDLPVLDLEADPKLNLAMEAVYDSVDDRDRSILDLKVGRNGNTPVSNQEIAMRLGVSPGLVSQRSLELSKQIQDTYGI